VKECLRFVDTINDYNLNGSSLIKQMRERRIKILAKSGGIDF